MNGSPPPSIKDFITDIIPKSRLLGIDLGDKTIGLALSDKTYIIASAFGIIKRKKFTKDAEILCSTIAEHDIGGIVIGLPIHMDGTEGRKCQSTRQFIRNFIKIQDIPVFFHDERFSTAATTHTLKEAGLSTGRRQDLVDKLSACYILQSALDLYNNQKKSL